MLSFNNYLIIGKLQSLFAFQHFLWISRHAFCLFFIHHTIELYSCPINKFQILNWSTAFWIYDEIRRDCNSRLEDFNTKPISSLLHFYYSRRQNWENLQWWLEDSHLKREPAQMQFGIIRERIYNSGVLTLELFVFNAVFLVLWTERICLCVTDTQRLLVYIFAVVLVHMYVQ